MELNQGLYCAVQNGSVSEVQSLLDRGASVNTTIYNNKNWSPLHLAALLNRTDVIQLLIKRNADVNLVDTEGETALHIAFSVGYILASEILIKHESSLDKRNNKGRRPFEVDLNDMQQMRRKGVNLEVVLADQKKNWRKCIYIPDDIPFDAFGGHESIYRKDIRHNRKTNIELNEPRFSDIRRTIVGFELKPGKDSITKYKTERRLDVFKDLKIGQEVAFGRMKIARNNYIYKHHGIIINIYDISGKFEIVELTATDTTANISAAVLSKNIKPRIEKKIIKFKDDIFYYDYDSLSFSNEVIKERAEMMVLIFDRSEVEYNLTKFNCEHFACYCATGLAFSGQTSYENIDATEALDKIYGGYHENIPDESKKKRCLVM